MNRLLIFLMVCVSATLNAQGTTKNQGTPTQNEVRFNTQFSQNIENDVMGIRMSITAENTTNAQVIHLINDKSNIIKGILTHYNDIEFKTTNYQVYPQHKDNTITHWRGAYDFSLTSKNFSVLSDVLTQVQKYANYNGVTFSISPAKREQVLTALLVKAVSKHRREAKRIADSFDATSFVFKTTNISKNNQSHSPRAYAARQSMLLADSAPSLESGKSSVTISIDSTIILQ